MSISPQLRHHLPLVGREHQLAIIHECLTAVQAGTGQLLLIGGEPGIGKTSLVEASVHEAAARGVFSVVGHGYDRADTPPYGPWIDLFLRYPTSPDVPPLPPAFAERGTVGPVASQLALVAQVQSFLTALTRRQPTLLVLEDLHWADPASLELLRFVAKAVPSLPLMVVVTYRQTEPSAPQLVVDLVASLTREAQPLRLDLRPLTRNDVAALVDGRYRLPPADVARLVAYLQQRSGGNALFVGELLRTLEEEGILTTTDGSTALGDPAQLGVPALLQQIIEGRIRRLGDAAMTLLMWAALIGQEVPIELWATVAGATEEQLFPILERAVRARVLVATPDGAHVRFAHALIRETLYEGVLPPRRRRLHQRIAETVTARPQPDPDVAAYHFRQAGNPRAAAWLVRAGERAQASYAYETAVARFEEALPFLEADPSLAKTRTAVLLRLACLLRLEAADPQLSVRYAESAIALATDLGDAVLAAVARFRLGTNLCLALRSQEGLAEMRAAAAILDRLPTEAAEQVRPLDPRSAAPWMRQAEYALRLAIVGRFAEAAPLAVAARTEGVRRRDGNYNASNALTHIYPAQGRVAEARAMFAECHALTIEVEEYYHTMLSLVYEIARVVLPYGADDLGYRDQAVRRAAAWIPQVTGPYAGLSLPAVLHGLYWLEGRWDEVADAALGSYGLQQEYAWVRGRIALARGEVQAGWSSIRSYLPEGPASEPGDAWFLGTTAGQRLAAALALAEQDLSAARAWLEAHERWLDWAQALLGRAEGTVLWAHYHRAAGDAERAQASATRAIELATQPRQPLVLLAAHRLLGELATAAGRDDAAGQHLQAALDLAAACQAPYERVLTLVAQAELLCYGRDRAQLDHVLADARTIGTALGAAPLLARIDALAAAVMPNSASGIRPGGLTARERDVLRLLVEGHSDRAIAQQLGIGTRTVQSHVTNILSKLGVSSRTAAAAHAVRDGLA